jgi:hypothetical protein
MLNILKKGLRKIASKKIIHQEFVFTRIFELRRQIVDHVLEFHSRDQIDIELLKTKAKLIQKYSRYLRLLQT